jgi:hypothetical protein
MPWRQFKQLDVKMRQQTYLQERSHALVKLPVEVRDEDDDPASGIISIQTEEAMILDSIVYVQGLIDPAPLSAGQEMADEMIRRLKAMFGTLEATRRLSLLRAAFFRYCYSDRHVYESDTPPTSNPLAKLRNTLVCGIKTKIRELLNERTMSELQSVFDEALVREMAITSNSLVMQQLWSSLEMARLFEEHSAMARGGYKMKRETIIMKNCAKPSSEHDEPHPLLPGLFATIFYDNLSALLFFLSRGGTRAEWITLTCNRKLHAGSSTIGTSAIPSITARQTKILGIASS